MAPKTIPMSAGRTRRDSKGNPRGKRAGWSAKWSDELKIGKDESAWIQLTPGKYSSEEGVQPYFSAPMFKLQFNNKFGTTSWGYFRGNGGPDCTLQKLADSNNPNVQEPKYGEPNRFYVGIIHYALYHKTPIEKNGQVITYSEGKLKGQPVYQWNEVKSVREKKQLLTAGDVDSLGFYRKKFLELPATQFKVVQEIARKARSICKCGGTLFPSVFVCPACENVLLDTNESDMTDSEIMNYADQDIRCRHCGAVEFPRAEYDCDSCADPRPHEYHEVVAKLKKVTGPTGYPTIALDSVVPVTEFTMENKQCPVTVNGEGALTYDESLDNLMKNQFDFEEYTKPRTNAEYAEMLGLREGDIGFASSAKRYNNFRG